MVKKFVKKLAKSLGYEVYSLKTYKYNKRHQFLRDIASLLNNNTSPIIFDVGANTGQSIHKFKQFFPNGIIYSFEPSPTTFAELAQHRKHISDVHLENLAVGSSNSHKTLLENTSHDMSSFLEIDKSGWGSIAKETMVETVSIDNYCHANHIERIDVLKSDTQGFEFEVLKGASEMLQKNKIQLVYFEFIMSDQYKGLPSFGVIYEFLIERRFRLVNFYDFHYQHGLLSWGDVLFVNSSYEANS